MDNVLLQTHRNFTSSSSTDYTPHASTSLLVVDPDSGRIYTGRIETDANGDQALLSVHASSSRDTLEPLYQLPLRSDEDANVELILLSFLAETQSIFVALSSGDLLLLPAPSEREELMSNDQVECVGSIDGGIAAAAWSPDDEILVLMSCYQVSQDLPPSLLLLSKYFDVIHEETLPIYESAVGEDALVNVGWGKKETQFHGSLGKSAALQPALPSRIRLCKHDKGQPLISWRFDGTYFACSILTLTEQIEQEDGVRGLCRRIYVYSREGRLQSTSEPVDALEGTLSWRPSGGNCIASSQMLPNGRYDVIFFEKNGLRHGEFPLKALRTSHERGNSVNQRRKVVDLKWNCDASMLAILVEFDGDYEENVDRHIEIWTMANYHWYRKLVLCGSEKFDSMLWHPEKKDILFAISGNPIHAYQYTLTFHVHRSYAAVNSECQYLDSGWVSVVDGCDAQITPFAVCNIPPPMARFTVPSFGQILDVSFFAENQIDIMALLIEGNTLHLWDIYPKGKPKENCRVLLPHQNYKQVCIIDKNQFALVRYDSRAGRDCLDIIEYDTISNTVRESGEFLLDGLASIISYSATFKKLIVEMSDARIYDFDFVSKMLNYFMKMPSSCPWIHAIVDEDKQLYVIGKSECNILYCNGRQLAGNCNSFTTFGKEYLVYTTTDHKIAFMHWSSICGVSANNTVLMRAVERGARLVVAPENDVNIVLQLPRGNLETIAPRALVIGLIKRHLDSHRFKDAFMLCRKHRVDMNILFDHDSSSWFNHALEFLTQINNSEHINLFLSELRNDSVCTTVYNEYYSIRLVEALTVDDKINRVCDTISQCIQEVDPEYNIFLFAKLVSYVKKSPPELENMLSMIAKLRRTNISLAEKALKYIIVFVDVENLFDAALGMYDFPLCIAVAQHSHKDPKEYLSFMASLQLLPQNYRKFKIDDHLKRYEKALLHLSQAGDERFEECLEYARKHELLKLTLEIYRGQDVKYKRVCLVHGESLLAVENYKDAVTAFVLAENWTRALETCLQGALWKDLFMIANRVKLPAVTIASYATQIVEALKDKHQWADAAIVALQYANIPELSVSLLLEGSLWDDAECLIYRNGLLSMIESHLKPSLLEAKEKLLYTIDKQQADFAKKRCRLLEVRQNPKIRVDAENDVEDTEEIDAFSDTSSVASRISTLSSMISRLTSLSSRSNMSSRQKRKMEKKKLRGKEGSVYEEDCLVDALRKNISYLTGLKNEVSQLVKVLLTYGFSSEAQLLQERMKTALKTVALAQRDIFEPPKIKLQDLPMNIKMMLVRAINEGGHEEVVDAVVKFMHPLEKPNATELADQSWCSEMF